ncbi:hypothetical protein Q7P37_008203 [Cladosporium fusiforme]
MAAQGASSSAEQAPAPGVALFRRAQAQWAGAAAHRPLPTPESGIEESDTKSLSSTSAVSSTAPTSTHEPSVVASAAASDAASTISAVPSAPVPTPEEGTLKKAGLPNGFLCLTADPPQGGAGAAAVATAAAAAVCSGLQTEVEDGRKRISDLERSHEQHLEHDAATKLAARREKRESDAKLAALEKAVVVVLGEIVPLAVDGASCSAQNVRSMARRQVGFQMVPDSSYPPW